MYSIMLKILNCSVNQMFSKRKNEKIKRVLIYDLNTLKTEWIVSVVECPTLCYSVHKCLIERYMRLLLICQEGNISDMSLPLVLLSRIQYLQGPGSTKKYWK